MDDSTRAALDSEAPVNPYSLLDAVNRAAARSNTAWLLFLALMAYAALTVGSLTHRDLLLDAGVVLPLLQVRIDLSRFFCDGARCFPVVGGAYIYKDDNHMNTTFAATLGPFLLTRMS